MNDLKNKKIGLVLSGGGAKGAYQVGMLRAFEEAGIAGQIQAVSGCSIGAYAAAIYAARGVDAYWDFLCRYPAMISGAEGQAEPVPEERKKDVADGKVSIECFASDRRYWRYEGEGLDRYFTQLLADGALARTGKRHYVCAYSLERERPVYFDLERLGEEEQKKAILASGCLPYLFKPVVMQGEHLLDGGVIPNLCRRPAPPDKIPVLPLLAEDVDVILINYLGVQDQVNTSMIPQGIAFAELRPSAPLEPYPSAGTLDFSIEKLESHRALGYADTCAFLSRLT